MTTLTYNRDASWVISRYVTYQLTEVLRRRMPSLMFADGMLIPDAGGVDPGAEEIAISLVEQYGEAAFMASEADDVPMAEASLTEDKFKIACIVAGCQYNIIEAESVEFASQNGQPAARLLNDLRVEQMVRMLYEKENKILAYGSAPRGITGFLNNPVVPLMNTSYNLYTSTNQQEIIDFFATIFSSISDQSNMTEMPNVCLLPDRLYWKLASTFRASGSDLTILGAIKEVVKDVIFSRCSELKSSALEAYGVHAGGNNKDRMVVYNLSPETLVKYSNPIARVPIQSNGIKLRQFAYKSFSGVYWKYPLSARYVDFPKFA